MIFGKESDKKLKYAKAKAKQVEFAVSPSLQPRFASESDDLHYSAVLALSNYASGRIDGSASGALLEDLIKTASFYDAAANEAAKTTLDDGYWQLAMATYFLIENYGSAKVAAMKVKNEQHYGENASIFTALVRYLLASGPRPSSLPMLCDFLEGGQTDEGAVYKEANGLDIWNSPEDLLFGELLVVAISDIVRASSRKLLPIYSSLDLTIWRNYLKSSNSSKILWQAQTKIGKAGVLSGNNSFIQLPTGSGKTRSIELLIRSRIYANACSLAIVVAPLRALCAEIAADLKQGLGDVAEIKRSSEVLEIDQWLRVNASKPSIIVFTPEKLSFVMHHEGSLLENANLFVFDEAHLIDSASRGPAYEMLLAEVRMRQPGAQMVLMSAVISNAKDMAQWAFGDPSLVVTGDGVKTTEKTVGSLARRGARLNFGTKVVFGTKDAPFEEEFFANIDLEEQELNRLPRERRTRLFPDFSLERSEIARDVATYFANRLSPNGASAIYIPKKKSIWPYFRRLGELEDHGCNLTALKGTLSLSEIERFKSLIELHYGQDCDLAKGVKAGILPHYGDLQGSIRQAVEFAVQKAHATCIACTSTLAEGVNLPIKYLFITGVKSGRSNPKTRDFQNLIGRAARSGKFSEGTVLITDPGTNRLSTQAEYSRLYSEIRTEACQSAILNLIKDEDNPESISRPVSLSGAAIVKSMLEHLRDQRLEAKLASAFVKVFECAESDAKAIANRRVKSLEAIESYVANAMFSDGEEIDVTQLCSATYAYACADDAERQLLMKVFQAIGETLKADESTPLCGRTQLGIRKSAGLTSWISKNETQEFFASDMSDLTVLIEGFIGIARPSDLKLTTGQLNQVVQMWISGANIAEISAALNRSFGSELPISPTPQAIEHILYHTIKYSMSHFVSCVIDALEANPMSSDSTWIEKVGSLQRKIKYGVDDPRSAAICEEIFDDRLVANTIVATVGSKWVPDAEIIRKMLQENRARIEEELRRLPAYYVSELGRWLRVRVPRGVNVLSHQTATANALADAGYEVEFRRRTQEQRAYSVNMVFDGAIWEVKSPESSKLRVVEKHIRAALHQSRDIVFDSRRMKDQSDETIEPEVRRWTTNLTYVRRMLYINRRGEVVKIK